jgi:hypothetical protein
LDLARILAPMDLVGDDQGAPAPKLHQMQVGAGGDRLLGGDVTSRAASNDLPSPGVTAAKVSVMSAASPDAAATSLARWRR